MLQKGSRVELAHSNDSVGGTIAEIHTVGLTSGGPTWLSIEVDWDDGHRGYLDMTEVKLVGVLDKLVEALEADE